MTQWSLGFIYIILPTLTLLYYCIPKTKRSLYLAVSSAALLYGWQGNITPLLLNCLLDYYLVKQMWDKQHTPEILRKLMAISVVKNGAIAMVFGILLPLWTGHVPLLGGIVIPLSASYYHLCLYRGKFLVEERPVVFFAYCLFFGKITVGPIENPTRLIPQLNNLEPDIEQIGEGISLIIMGLAKKVLLYDNLTRVTNEIIAIPQNAITLMATLLLILLTSIRIYLLFASCSDLAKGIAGIFSIKLTRNVYYPLQARGVYEYVYRFNMTLAVFLEDLFSVESWDKEIGNTKKRLAITAILSLFVAMWIQPSLYAVLWAGMMTILVGLQLLLPDRFYLYTPPFFVRLLTAVTTMPMVLLLSGIRLTDLVAWLSSLLGQAKIYNNDILYIFSSNYLVILIAFVGVTSIMDILLRNTKDRLPTLYRIGGMVFSLVLLLITTSFMLMEVTI